jgi:enolase-phosphatase E1
VGLQAGEILFLSDIEEELDAAVSAGMSACQLVRDADATIASARHLQAADFFAVDAIVRV